MRRALDRADLLLSAGKYQEARTVVRDGWRLTTAGNDLLNRLRQLELWSADLAHSAEPRRALMGLVGVAQQAADRLALIAEGEHTSRQDLAALAQMLQQAVDAVWVGRMPAGEEDSPAA